MTFRWEFIDRSQKFPSLAVFPLVNGQLNLLLPSDASFSATILRTCSRDYSTIFHCKRQSWRLYRMISSITDPTEQHIFNCGFREILSHTFRLFAGHSWKFTVVLQYKHIFHRTVRVMPSFSTTIFAQKGSTFGKTGEVPVAIAAPFHVPQLSVLPRMSYKHWESHCVQTTVRFVEFSDADSPKCSTNCIWRAQFLTILFLEARPISLLHRTVADLPNSLSCNLATQRAPWHRASDLLTHDFLRPILQGL